MEESRAWKGYQRLKHKIASAVRLKAIVMVVVLPFAFAVLLAVIAEQVPALVSMDDPYVPAELEPPPAGPWFSASTRRLVDVTAAGSALSSTTAPGSAAGNFAYHKLLMPFNSWDYIGFAVSALGLIVAAGGGIGGGGVIVPLYILLLKFRPKHAIPLSNVTILGGAIANTFFNCRKRHPSQDRPVIDWDMILIMEPSTIAGAVIGSFLAKWLPDAVLQTTLALLLIILGWRSLSKGIKMWKEESDNMSDSSEDEGSGEEKQSLTSAREQDDAGDKPGNARAREDVSEEMQEILDREKTTPWCKVATLSVCSLGCIGFTILKGGGQVNPLNVTCGSVLFWVTSIATIPWVLLFAAVFRCILLAATEDKQEAGFELGPDDFSWDEETTVRYPAICTFAGLFAGLFGVGGGIVKGPLMLEMGVKPAVASATAATMILFTTLSASVSFAVFGIIQWDYALAVFLLGFFSTIIGQVGINALMAGSGRQSPIVISVGSVIVLSSMMVGISSIYRNWGKSMTTLLQVESLCK